MSAIHAFTRPQSSAETAIRTSPHFQEMVQRIYRQMPDARMPPWEEERGCYLWGEVEDTQQYAFCEQIAFEIVAAAQAYAR